MKKLLLFVLPLALLSCGGEEKKENVGGTLDLSEHGLKASIEAGTPKEVKAMDLQTNYERKLFEKTIDIVYEDDLLLSIQEAKENEVKGKVEFAQKFGDEVVESGDNYFIIKTERAGEERFDAAVYYEKDGAVIMVRVADFNMHFNSSSLEQAKKGLEIAKTLKFK